MPMVQPGQLNFDLNMAPHASKLGNLQSQRESGDDYQDESRAGAERRPLRQLEKGNRQYGHNERHTPAGELAYAERRRGT